MEQRSSDASATTGPIAAPARSLPTRRVSPAILAGVAIAGLLVVAGVAGGAWLALSGATPEAVPVAAAPVPPPVAEPTPAPPAEPPAAETAPVEPEAPALPVAPDPPAAEEPAPVEAPPRAERRSEGSRRTERSTRRRGQGRPGISTEW